MATESPIPAKYKPSGLIYPLQTGIWRIRNAERSANDIPPEANVFGSGGVFANYRSKGRHGGWDLQADIGTAVYSIRGGKIEYVGINDEVSGWGPNHVLQTFTFNKKEYTIRYCHLSRAAAQLGTKIDEGVIIGYSGATGKGSPPHLHIEFKYQGTPVNPTVFFGSPPF